MKKIKILISGAGPAGLIAALALDPKRVDVTIVERSKELLTMGYSIILWKNGVDVLDSVGISKGEDIFHPLDKFNVFGSNKSKTITSIDTKGIGYSIKRKDLVSRLYKRLLVHNPDVKFSFGTTISDISNISFRPKVKLSNNTVGDYDYVLICEGIHSDEAKKYFGTKIKSEKYDISYSWLNGKTGMKNEAVVGYAKDHLYLMQTVGDETLLAYYSRKNNNNENFENQLKELIKTNHGFTLEINKETQKIFSLESVKAKSVINGKLILIGDSLHGNHPTLAMGTSFALEDGYNLGVLINKLAGSQEPDLAHAKIFTDYASTQASRLKETYDFQHRVEKILLSHSSLRLRIVDIILNLGVWNYLEYKMKKLVTAN